MARDTKVRTRKQEGKVEVLVLVNHPMETGMRKEKASGQLVPQHFIKEMTVSHNGAIVVSANMGIGVSENPLLGFRLKNGKNGDKLKISWSDNKGETGVAEAVVDVS